MKLATWNVNSLGARLPRVLEFLAEHAPDVLCLQETKTTPEAFPHAELSEAGYHAADASGGRWAGVAILAREPLTDVVAGLAGETEARWIEATTAGLRVVSTYVPNGRAVGSEWYEQKLRFFAAAAERMEELPEPKALLGDVNVCPTDTDVYDPAAFAGSTHVQPEERAALAAVLERGGLVDAYRAVHPEPEVGFTWWDYRQGHFHRKMGLRIDLVLVSPTVTVGECGIDRGYRKGPKPSDHAPLIAEVEVGAGLKRV